MPFRVPPAPICPVCNQRVYAAEERKGNGYSYHKHCFVCCNCRKSLDATTLAEHGAEIYCKTCHGAKFGTKGYGYGVGAGCLNLNDAPVGAGASPEEILNGVHLGAANNLVRVPPAGPGQEACPRCGGAVYLAERVLGADRSWHRRCFVCGICGTSLSGGKFNDRDGDIFCNVCYGSYFGTRAQELGGQPSFNNQVHFERVVAASAPMGVVSPGLGGGGYVQPQFHQQPQYQQQQYQPQYHHQTATPYQKPAPQQYHQTSYNQGYQPPASNGLQHQMSHPSNTVTLNVGGNRQPGFNRSMSQGGYHQGGHRYEDGDL